MKVSRKSFIASAGAFAAMRASGAEKPLWTAGIVTDTHVRRTRESCAKFKMACDFFAKKGIDIFVNCGDIADHYYPEAYPILKEMSDAAFPSKPPKKIWVYANHDRVDRKDEPWEKVFADVKRLLGGTHDFYDVIDMKGWPLVVFPQFLDFAKAEKILSDVCANPKYAGKPVILFDHVPPRGTTDNSDTWGSEDRMRVYSRFPRLVHVCGHAHSSLRSELNIWQGAFTVVGMGCLSGWAGHAVGRPPEGKESYGAVVLEAFEDRLVFRRFDVRTGCEYSADAPWAVPLPFDPATAPYRRERAAKGEPIPQFPAGATLSFKPDSPFTTLSLSCPCAEGPHGTYQYKVEAVAKKPDAASSRCDVFGQFHLPEGERKKYAEFRLNAAQFDPGSGYVLRVTPRNCFGGEGRPLEAEFVAPEPADGFVTLFESRDPMTECPFMSGLKDGERLAAKDGWYWIGADNYRLTFPDTVWKGAGLYRFTVDMRTVQDSSRTWTMLLRSQFPKTWNANARIATPQGDSGMVRYVIEANKKDPERTCSLLIREGVKGRIMFGRVRIDKLAARD